MVTFTREELISAICEEIKLDLKARIVTTGHLNSDITREGILIPEIVDRLVKEGLIVILREDLNKTVIKAPL